jgi:hypothetical protein
MTEKIKTLGNYLEIFCNLVEIYQLQVSRLLLETKSTSSAHNFLICIINEKKPISAIDLYGH